MHGKAIYRYNVKDKHTGEILGAFSTERGANNAAVRYGIRFNSPNRYVVVKR